MSDTDPAVVKRREKIKVARRRAKVLEMYNRGHTQAEMAEALGVGQATISRDIRALSAKASGALGELFGKKLELEFARLIAGVDGATKMVWDMLDDKNLPPKQRIAAVTILLKCYDTRKAYFPEAYSAKEYLEQRKLMMDEMDELLDAAIKERGLDPPEKEEQVAPPAPDKQGELH